MGEQTAIGWTDHTFNPWWGCERVSPGCQHCYAEGFAKRTGHDVWGKTADRRMFGDKHWAEPLRWDRDAAAAGRPALVFCASMADVFEDRDDLIDERYRLYDLIDRTPHLIWQLLTKRPANVCRMTEGHWPMSLPSNVWIGCTVEDQQRAEERLPFLTDVPAVVRFVSAEPLLGPVDLDPWLDLHGAPWRAEPRRRAINWVIVGGESGPGHRALDIAQARTLVEQCERDDVPVFFKQVGGRIPTAGGDLLDGRQIKQFPPEAMR